VTHPSEFCLPIADKADEEDGDEVDEVPAAKKNHL